MTTPIHKLLQQARKAAGLSQMALAEQAGCRQSQLSAFEAGVPGKVTKETIEKMASILGVELPTEMTPPQLPALPGVAFCPNFQCLSNLPYFIGDDLLFLPLGTAGDGKHCLICGEVLERRCPSCGAPVRHGGGCCPDCGQPFIAMPEGYTADVPAWVRNQQSAITALTQAASRLIAER